MYIIQEASKLLNQYAFTPYQIIDFDPTTIVGRIYSNGVTEGYKFFFDSFKVIVFLARISENFVSIKQILIPDEDSLMWAKQEVLLLR